jgi:hypothetical protein
MEKRRGYEYVRGASGFDKAGHLERMGQIPLCAIRLPRESVRTTDQVHRSAR